MTNLEYRNSVYKILGKDPIQPEEHIGNEKDIDLKKELKKQKRLKDQYLANYKKVARSSKKEK